MKLYALTENELGNKVIVEYLGTVPLFQLGDYVLYFLSDKREKKGTGIIVGTQMLNFFGQDERVESVIQYHVQGADGEYLDVDEELIIQLVE